MRNILLLMLFTIPTSIFAKHIIGGEMSYTCKGFNASKSEVTFTVNLTLYRDAGGSGADFDYSAEIGIFKGRAGVWGYYKTINTSSPSVSNFDINSSTPCFDPVSRLNYEQGDYVFDVTLPVSSTESYLLTYTRCCRADNITNILYSGDEGGTYFIEITPEAQKNCDSSPKFTSDRSSVICVSQGINASFAVEDDNAADRVEYELCSPTSGGGTAGATGAGNAEDCNGITPDPSKCGPQLKPLKFRNGYRYDKPLKASPAVQIDRNTGHMTGFPEIEGVFAMAVCATSYRGFKRLTTVKRDFQFTVTKCKKEIKASYFAPDCTGKTITLKNGRESNSKYVDEYTWEVYKKDGTILSSNDVDPTFTFTDYGLYDGKLVINRDSPYENCRDSVDVQFNVQPGIEAGMKLDYDKCVYEAINFVDESKSPDSKIDEYKWIINGSETSTTKDFSQKLTTPGSKTIEHKIVDENGCRDSIQQKIEYYPIPDVKYKRGKVGICTPVNVDFEEDMEFIDNSYNFTWNFGSLGTFSGQNPTVLFKDSGKYPFSIKVEKNGCESILDNQEISISKATAGFKLEYDECKHEAISFIDTSTSDKSKITQYFWSVNGDQFSTTKNASKLLAKAGQKVIQHKIVDENGCADSTQYTIDYYPAPNEVKYILDNKSFCIPVDINFRPDMELLDNKYTLVWDFGSRKYNDNNPTVKFEQLGIFNFTLSVQSPLNCLAKSDPMEFEVSSPKADLRVVYDTCKHEPINFIDQSNAYLNPIVSYEWKVNDEPLATTKNVSSMLETSGRKNVFLKVVDDKGCADSTEYKFYYYPAPNEVTFDINKVDLCAPTILNFVPTMTVVDPSYKITWDIDGLGTFEEYSPAVEFTKQGIYGLTVNVESRFNCLITYDAPDIEILESPKAGFSYTPEYPNQFKKEVDFTDESEKANTYKWYIGDAGTFTQPSPSVTFIDTGYQEVQQIVTHVNGCQDTLTQVIDVTPRTTFYMPNAFTPNADGHNDIFRGKGVTDNIVKFSMLVFNRWGEKIYETDQPTEGWAGNLPNGNSAPAETYTYKVDYIGARGQKQELRGSFLLLR